MHLSAFALSPSSEKTNLEMRPWGVRCLLIACYTVCSVEHGMQRRTSFFFFFLFWWFTALHRLLCHLGVTSLDESFAALEVAGGGGAVGRGALTLFGVELGVYFVVYVVYTSNF